MTQTADLKSVCSCPQLLDREMLKRTAKSGARFLDQPGRKLPKYPVFNPDPLTLGEFEI